MSWQPLAPGVPRKSVSSNVGCDMTEAVSGASRGTSTTEIFECPWLPSGLSGWQSVPKGVGPGEDVGYDEMYRRTRFSSGSGTRVCVWEPQSVGTAGLRSSGAVVVGLLTTSILNPF